MVVYKVISAQSLQQLRLGKKGICFMQWHVYLYTYIHIYIYIYIYIYILGTLHMHTLHTKLHTQTTDYRFYIQKFHKISQKSPKTLESNYSVSFPPHFLLLH